MAVMAYKRDPWLQKFWQTVLPRLWKELKPKKVIVFGSRIRGEADEYSDLDVVVISEAFAQIPFLERLAYMVRKYPFPKHVDYLCYTPDEWRRIYPKSFILEEAVRTGLEITTEAEVAQQPSPLQS